MASNHSPMPMNGNYGTNGQYNLGHDHSTTVAGSDSHMGSSITSGQHDIEDSKTSTPSREEIGWSFVQQYYTRLSEKPDELYWFYHKKSSSVWGDEGAKVVMAVGRS